MLVRFLVASALLVAPALAKAPDIARPSLTEKQISDLKTGRGMGMALPAELNGYPGPTHVLEHAAALGLSETQKAKAQALLNAMKGETIPLGEKLIAQEAALDALFASRSADLPRLQAITSEIGTTQASLRAAHLRYHIEMLGVLTDNQVAQYALLRGYGDKAPEHHGAH